MPTIRGKSIKATAYDVAEGYVVVNPLFLKPLDEESLKELYTEMHKVQIIIRGEKFPQGDMKAIRWRNIRLQRLNSATIILKNFARERKIMLL
jgi:deoxyxylulose-5-phosphate synthase